MSAYPFKFAPQRHCYINIRKENRVLPPYKNRFTRLGEAVMPFARVGRYKAHNGIGHAGTHVCLSLPNQTGQGLWFRGLIERYTGGKGVPWKATVVSYAGK